MLAVNGDLYIVIAVKQQKSWSNLKGYDKNKRFSPSLVILLGKTHIEIITSYLYVSSLSRLLKAFVDTNDNYVNDIVSLWLSDLKKDSLQTLNIVYLFTFFSSQYIYLRLKIWEFCFLLIGKANVRPRLSPYLKYGVFH